MQMISVILLMQFVGDGEQAALPPPPSQALGMWMELQWSLWTTKALLFCQRSRANNAPKKSAPELRSPDQKQKNKVCSNANYLS